MVTKERYKQSKRDGGAAEKRYVWATGDARKASRTEDIHSHIDFWHGEDGVDVKGNNFLDEIWVEFRNVNGNLGWLCGKAKWIAFEICEVGGFLRVEREELYQWCLKNVDFSSSTSKEEAHKRIYQRSGRKDKITKLSIADIFELKNNQLLPYRKWFINPATQEKKDLEMLSLLSSKL
tara:strand:+ start:961 stop:1494 length:534 start_codon:yes stop_codon:yes gene_type:complete